MMLGLGEVGFGIASLGSTPVHDYGVADSFDDESRPARTWYGRILQWTWAILVFLLGLAVLVVALAAAVAWLLSWFD
jgi:hypothetical protein